MGQHCSSPDEHDSEVEDDDSEYSGSCRTVSGELGDPPSLWERLTGLFQGAESNESKSKSQGLNIKVTLPYNEGKRIEDFFDLLRKEKLGEGGYGTVCEGKEKHTGVRYAVKSIGKAMVKDAEKLQQEIRIMTRLDHPNVIKLFQTFQDKRFVYLVMEMCQGGELFDKIIQEKHFSEPVAAIVMQQVFRAINYIHEMNIVHRDLKPENLMFLSKGPIPGNCLKVIDFGIAAEWKNKPLTSKNGTPYYVAPEMVQLLGGGKGGGGYGKECDVWSCGVIMYILLSGTLPFKAQKEQETLEKVKSGKLHWRNFQNVSEDAKELIKRLLTVDPRKRCTLQQALSDTWIVHQAPNSRSQSLMAMQSSQVIANLKQFAHENQLKKAALHIVARQTDERTLDQLRSVFTEMDTNGDGTLTMQELNDGLQKAGLMDVEVLRDLVKALDSDGSGSIDYTEFLAATLDHSRATQESACWSAFRVFDKNNDGVISLQELKDVLESRDVQQHLPKDCIKNIMSDVDTNGDGVIDFEEFMQMMRR